MAGDDYGDYQNPTGGYGDQTAGGTLVADNTGTKPGPASTPPASTSKPAPTAPAVIEVSVNPASRVKIADLVKLINNSPGIVPEFKGKITLNKTRNTIGVPDFSAQQVVPGQEWRFDLGKAGNNWEITTAKLVANLDGPTFFVLQEDLQKGEERGYVTSTDPDEGLIRPSRDFEDIRRGLIVGLTIPNQAILDRNPPPPNTVPPPQIARLRSGRGLILIAADIAVQKGDKITTDRFPVPKSMMAMSFFHELSAHASFFALGQAAAHSDPPDPSKNVVDRNAAQAEASYRAAISKDIDVVQKKLQQYIDAMKKK